MSAGRNHQQNHTFPLRWKKKAQAWEPRLAVQIKKPIFQSSIIHLGTSHPSCAGGKWLTASPAQAVLSKRVHQQMACPSTDVLWLSLSLLWDRGQYVPLSLQSDSLKTLWDCVIVFYLINLSLARREDVVWPQNLLSILSRVTLPRKCIDLSDHIHRKGDHWMFPSAKEFTEKKYS